MQNAGITPDAVPRKGREERNTGDSQRRKRAEAQMRKGYCETVLLGHVQPRTDAGKTKTMLAERKDRVTVGGAWFLVS